MIELNVAGTQYTNFTRAECEIRLDALTNVFSFDASIPGGNNFPFNGGEVAKVYVSGELVMTGFIEVINVRYDRNDHIITFAGRDKTADLIDSTLDAMPDFRGAGVSIKTIIEQVIAHLGLNISVFQEVPTDAFRNEEDLLSPEPGMNAFDFIEKYAQKRQILLTSDKDGNVLITKNTGTKSTGRLHNRIASNDNNVLSADFTYDTTGRYNLYKMASDLNPTTLNFAGSTDFENLVNQRNQATDSEIRTTRVLTFIPPNSFSAVEGQNRALWEANVRRARGLKYNCSVDGFRVGVNTGDLWRINRLYEVVDDYVGKVEPMLCNATIFSYDRKGGSDTKLELLGGNAYTNNLGSLPETRSFRAIGNESFNALQ